jgi:hypothetical protein
MLRYKEETLATKRELKDKELEELRGVAQVIVLTWWMLLRKA